MGRVVPFYLLILWVAVLLSKSTVHSEELKEQAEVKEEADSEALNKLNDDDEFIFSGSILLGLAAKAIIKVVAAKAIKTGIAYFAKKGLAFGAKKLLKYGAKKLIKHGAKKTL